MLHTVTITIPDIHAADSHEAAKLAIAALVSAYWASGLGVEVTSDDGRTDHVTLDDNEVKAALAQGEAATE